MIPYYGDFAEDDTVLLPFNTFDSNDPAASVTITDLVDADIKVHKDGGVTPIVTDGATIAINYASITGNHLITIDTSAHADYATGSEYSVRIEGTTVDGATINAWIGSFSIERAAGALAVAKLIQTAVITNAAGVDVAADIIAMKAETVLIVGDTNELQTDWVNGGRLDLILDARMAEASISTTAGAVNTVTTVTTTTTNSDMRGTDSAALASVCTEPRLSELDEATAGKVANQIDIIQTDTTTDIPGTITTLQSDTDNIQTRLPDALVSGNIKADMLAISGDAPAADNLEESATAIVVNTSKAGTLSTTQMSTNLTEATDGHYTGRTVIWTTGVLANQGSDITGYVGVNGVLTFTEITEAPGIGDTFVIV